MTAAQRLELYRERGAENRSEYLAGLADENCIPLDEVEMMADALGPNEEFDGLVTHCEDRAAGY